MSKRLPLVLIILLIVGCGSVDRKTSLELRKLVLAQDYDGAIQTLKQSPLQDNEKSFLLYHFELGLLNHYKGDYDQSIEALTKAKELIDELYTTKVSGKFQSFLSNDNADLYYGEKYEASLVYFYLALNHYMKSTQESDSEKKKVFLRLARSEVMAWDSFLTEMKTERMGEALFKQDLLAKTFGAFIHEAQGTREDKRIAVQLYVDAIEVYFKYYNLYPTFNASFEAFRENYKNLGKLPLEEVHGKYVLETEQSRAFREFIANKAKQFSNERNLASSGDSTPAGNVTFLVQDGLIIQKLAKEHVIPLNFTGHSSFHTGNTIMFELPYVETPPASQVAKIVATDTSGQVLFETPLSVIAPLSEMAQQAVNEHSTSIATKTGARLVTKHTAAILASEAAYEVAKNNNPSMAYMVASLAHTTAVAAINESEKADLRYWSTLPSSVRMGSLSVRPGTYQFRVVYQSGEVLELGQHQVGLGEAKLVVNKLR
jgi:uncharacterized protein